MIDCFTEGVDLGGGSQENEKISLNKMLQHKPGPASSVVEHSLCNNSSLQHSSWNPNVRQDFITPWQNIMHDFEFSKHVNRNLANSKNGTKKA